MTCGTSSARGIGVSASAQTPASAAGREEIATSTSASQEATGSEGKGSSRGSSWISGWAAASACTSSGLVIAGGRPRKPQSIAPFSARASASGDVRRLVVGRDGRARLLEEQRSGGREADPARMAFEQLEPDVLLEVGDRLRERGLRHVQLAPRRW